MQFNDDFLLTTEWARKLFHGHAEKMPIIDYHCHLVPSEIHENKGYENLAQVWLYDNGFGDHYKWRLMRANGTPESVIRGDDDHAKYLAFVDAVERAVGNPIYDWSHLELRRFFGIEERICRKNAETIWERANALITTDDFRAKRLIQRMNVTCVCTTDDPASDLAHHKLLAAEEAGNGFKVLPTFRPDGLMGIDGEGFSAYCDRLSDVSGIDVVDWESLKAAAAQRIDFFHEAGGRLADHGMNSFVFCPASDEVVDQIVCRALNDEGATAAETAAYQSALALFLMGEYATHDWTLQLHMNCFRNDSSKNFGLIGVDAGFDTVGDQPDMVYQVKCLLDAAESADGLPKCILYSLNESDWLGLASLCGAFQSAPARPRIQFGNAWWFNDTFSGMKKQLTMCAEQGLLGNFTGMLTDSRSFMSYPRHEYFRRILCHTIGEWVEMGRLPEDEEYLGGIVEDICYNNAHDYFGFFE
ncbi:glucuronate isomerase [Paratractidigestivibacter sp.]|uniref:glucuronate isomerase n=1 Tax=Paratractidigestivibacter sp. TaxID=2847316 RepID=UPI002AC9A9CC|nr:glucuronate isomerase [Paratractidigestivibacter sp.]